MSEQLESSETVIASPDFLRAVPEESLTPLTRELIKDLLAGGSDSNNFWMGLPGSYFRGTIEQEAAEDPQDQTYARAVARYAAIDSALDEAGVPRQDVLALSQELATTDAFSPKMAGIRARVTQLFLRIGPILLRSGQDLNDILR